MAGDLGDSLINQGSPENNCPLQSGWHCDLYSGHGHGYSTISMAGDLWDAPILQGSPESSYPMQSGWQSDFYSGQGHDVIEEDALNEKSCLKVLRIMIAEKDAEIDELEKQLVLLQIQLACAEHEGLFKICCDSLREKIDLLNISIKNLRNNDQNDIRVQLPMHEKPAEKIQEILKALLQKCLQEKDNQPADTLVKVSSSDSFIASGFYNDIRNSCSSDMPVNGNMEVRKHPTAEKYKILNSSLNLDKNGMLRKADQPTTQSPVDNGKNESSESQLGASRVAKNKNCGGERKLIDFIPETAQQEGIKDSKVTMLRRCSKIQRYEEKWKTNSNLPSTTEGKDLAANFHSSDLLSDATDGGSSKEDVKITRPSSFDNDSSTCAIVPFAGANNECSSLAIVPFSSASDHKCNALAITPFASANDDCSASATVAVASANDDYSPLAIVPAREKNLMDMTVNELKVVARQNNLKGCYKLRRDVLMKFLKDKLGR